MVSHDLKGKHILLTRSVGQLAALENQVRCRQGIPVAFPCLLVQTMPDQIQTALQNIGDFSDVVFTSSNGVSCVAGVVGNLPELLRGKRIAAVGEHTAEALRDLGIEPDMIPNLASQAGLADAYNASGLPEKLLFFRAREGRELLHRALSDAGVEVQTVSAYQTVCPQEDSSEVVRLLNENQIDGVLLGSPKAASFYVQRVGDVRLADQPAIAVLGERVKAQAEALGLSVQVVAKDASFESMLDGLAAFFDGQQQA